MKNSQKAHVSHKRKGIYILPNLFTIGSMFSGFYAIIAASNDHFSCAPIAIFIAMILDALDGRVARLINAQSAFGAELDSLSDIISFGVATSLVMFNFALVHLKSMGLGQMGWISAFIYVACVAIRLARFNISAPDKRYFQGLPCPAAAAVLMALVWVANIHHWSGGWIWVAFAVMTICLGLLQVCSVPYRSFKDVNMTGSAKVSGLLIFVIAIALIAIRPAEFLLLIFGVYAFSGIYLSGYRFVRRHILRLKKHAK